MGTGKCPDCGAQHFYVKDPDDQYTISEFSLETGKLKYLDDDEDEHLAVSEDTETYCERCAWHDKFRVLRGED